ncbi:LicD family protein [Albibacterium indicum]|uniref:LicD family protein n=1 Tax=Albibacterium indicum TaxID=2292082 RepID=UPI0019806033|nr:LicD family protein [Pedobacter indicus]
MIIFNLQLPEKVLFDKKNSNISSVVESNIENIQSKHKNGELKVDNNWHKIQYGFGISQSEIDIFQTHYYAWKQFLKSNENMCLIIQENLVLSEMFYEGYSEWEQLPTDWDVFFPYNPYQKNNSEPEDNNRPCLLNPNIREIDEHDSHFMGIDWGGAIYFLNRSGAEKLIKTELIKQCVQDEIVMQTMYGTLNLYYENVEWFSYKECAKLHIIDRESNILSEVLNYNTWQAKDEVLLKDILSTLSTISSNKNIDLVLQGGTLLGHIRHGRKMPWDDDIDLGIEEKNLDLFLEEVKKSGLFVDIFLENHTETFYYKIWSQNGRKIQGYPYTFPFIDIWLFNYDGNNIKFKNGIICPNSALKPLIKVEFEGSGFSIPYNSIECLDARYKDWKSKIRIYPWSHQEEKPINYCLNANIEVDAHGRIK